MLFSMENCISLFYAKLNLKYFFHQHVCYTRKVDLTMSTSPPRPNISKTLFGPFNFSFYYLELYKN
jgi:hypothetical protein